MQPGTRRFDRKLRFPVSRPLRHRRIALVAILAVLLCSMAAPARAAEQAGAYEDLPAIRWDPNLIRTPDGGESPLERELYRQGEYGRRWNMIHQMVGHRHVSSKSRELLRRRGLGPALFDKSAPPVDYGIQADDDTLRVLIVRVAFDTNRQPNLNTIEPDGDFMLTPLADPAPLEIDPPPHGKAYFADHLDGLTEYYKFMSGGRLNIAGRILPEGDQDSYKLGDIADYGPGAGNFWSIESLEKLVRDIIGTADAGTQADGSVNLADFDDDNPNTYIIFVHAGSDWQSDINGDSPNDIPTFFVTLGEPQDLIGTDGTTGAAGKLSECSIIPETTNTDGFPGSIAAAFYHEFGHALGLPDVYSTRNGLPSVGIWDLMDSGTNLPVTLGTITAENDTFVISATGVLPPSLSAWNKWYLGWLEVANLDGRTGDYFLPAVGVPRADYPIWDAGYGDFNPSYPQAYRAGISQREWFLLENRWVAVDPSETPFDDIRWERDEVSQTGVIKYLAGQLLGTWQNSGLYDYFMPGGGVLVWHVNMDRIDSELASNTINAFGDGLRLVEADGIQDIGVLNAYVRGWFGSAADPFGGFDISGFPPYPPTGYENLYVEGFPNSRAFDRSWTGLSLSEVKQRVPRTASVMKFKAAIEPLTAGYPWEIGPVTAAEAAGYGGAAGPRAIDTRTLTPVILAQGTEQLLVFADAPGQDHAGGDFPATLYGRWADGQERWAPLPGKPTGAFQTLDAPLTGSPVALEAPGGGVDLVWATTAGTLGSTFLPDLVQPQAQPDWTLAAGDSITGGPLALQTADGGFRLLATVFPDTLILADRDGTVLGDPLKLVAPGAALPAGLTAAAVVGGTGESDRVAVFAAAGWFLVELGAAGLEIDPAYVPYALTPPSTPTWTAVVDHPDGHLLYAFTAGVEVGTWLVGPDGDITDLGTTLTLDEPLVCPPAVADLDGDGGNDLVMATGRRIHARGRGGVAIRGFPVRFYDLFPLPDTTRIDGPLIVADGTGDGVNDIYFNTDGGHLVGLGATGRLLPHTPFRWGDRFEPGLAVGGLQAERVLWLVSRGGYVGDGYGTQVANGMVAGYNLAGTVSSGERTSEWLGAGGGITRRGPAGLPQTLGSAAPVAAETNKVVLYPNPLTGPEVTLRFYSHGTTPARLGIYNLTGELVAQADIPVTADAVNEFKLPLPGIASGLYLARVQYEAAGGMEIRTLTLAVEK